MNRCFSIFLLELCDTKLLDVLLLLCRSKNFFYLGFLSGIFTIHRTVEEGMGGIYLTPLYHFHPLHRHLDISQAITAESSPLPIVSSWTWTGNLWFYCFCFYRYYIYIIKAANVYITLFITIIFFGIIFVYFVTIATIHIIHVIISTNIILPLPLLLLLSSSSSSTFAIVSYCCSYYSTFYCY